MKTAPLPQRADYATDAYYAEALLSHIMHLDHLMALQEAHHSRCMDLILAPAKVETPEQAHAA